VHDIKSLTLIVSLFTMLINFFYIIKIRNYAGIIVLDIMSTAVPERQRNRQHHFMWKHGKNQKDKFDNLGKMNYA
jgi:hypothetical protein